MLLLAFSLWLDAQTTSLALPEVEAPQCAEPSHDRLRVQKGRDVCAPALSPAGLELSPGLMPTRCARGFVLQVDADGLRDLCLRKP